MPTETHYSLYIEHREDTIPQMADFLTDVAADMLLGGKKGDGWFLAEIVDDLLETAK